jgi:hypothetical protein
MKKISTLILASSIGLAAQAQLVDTLNNTTLSPYTQTTILQNGASSGITFSDTSGSLTSTGGGTVPDQVLLLRNDYSLAVGETLSISISGLGTSSANADFGIAIASQVNPVPFVYSGISGSTRSNFLAMYVKPGSSQVGSIGFNGTSQLYSSGGVTPPGGAYSTVNGLWITETAANVFSDGYTTPSGNVTVGSGITFTGALIDNSIGFYSDMRGTITSAALFNNLTITPAPEPSMLALCGVGLVGMFGVMRRKK